MSTLVENKKIRLNYEILKTFEAGIELLGHEVKALRARRGSIIGAFIIVRGAEVFVVSMNIPPYQTGNTPNSYDPERPRRLLLKKGEINEIIGIEKQKGLTIAPIKVYTKGRNLKVEIAVLRGKKKFDKRESIKKKDSERDIKRSLKKHFNI